MNFSSNKDQTAGNIRLFLGDSLSLQVSRAPDPSVVYALRFNEDSSLSLIPVITSKGIEKGTKAVEEPDPSDTEINRRCKEVMYRVHESAWINGTINSVPLEHFTEDELREILNYMIRRNAPKGNFTI